MEQQRLFNKIQIFSVFRAVTESIILSRGDIPQWEQGQPRKDLISCCVWESELGLDQGLGVGKREVS